MTSPNTSSADWYLLENSSTLDTPSVVIYKERVQRNIDEMIRIAGGAERIFTHVKTNKTSNVVRMLLAAGITKFKCATLVEAEMVAQTGGQYLIIAHQLVGPKIDRLITLRQQYPAVFMASLVDCYEVADDLNTKFGAAGLTADVFVDVNNGMDRSGHPLDADILPLYTYLHNLPHLQCHGLHVYDGHLRQSDFTERKQLIDAGFTDVEQFIEAIEQAGLPRPMVVAGGTPAFTSHALRNNTFCSPGTCVFWDWGYGDKLTEQPFQYAALVLTRVISKPSPGLVSIDMGHKAVAAENSIDHRIRFLNLTDYELLSQSEEHGVLRVADWASIHVGDLLYGVPYHVCPTINLYDDLYVAEDGKVIDEWPVTARRRRTMVTSHW